MCETPDHDQFLGYYEAEFMPMWDRVEIVKRDGNYLLLLRTPGDTKNIPLKPAQATLEGEHTEDGATGHITVVLDPTSHQIILEIRLLTEDKRIQARILDSIRFIKVEPHQDRAAEYDVTAADVVRKVRESEQWIHQIQSLCLSAQTHWTRTEEGIALLEQEMKREHPGADLSQKRSWGLLPKQEGT